MKQGDIIQTFGDPVHCTTPTGQAKLIKKLADHNNILEEWRVEYTDYPDHFYNVLIKKMDNGTNKS